MHYTEATLESHNRLAHGFVPKQKPHLWVQTDKHIFGRRGWPFLGIGRSNRTKHPPYVAGADRQPTAARLEGREPTFIGR